MATKAAVQSSLGTEITSKLSVLRQSVFKHTHLLARSQLHEERRHFERLLGLIDEVSALVSELSEQHGVLSGELERAVSGLGLAKEVESNGG